MAHVQVKLNRGIEILSRLRHNANLKTLKIVYPICGRYQLCIAARAGYHYERLVIFPMSGNNTFEAQILQAYAFLFEAARVPRFLSHSVLMEKLLRNIKQMILCSPSKEFAFSCFWLEKSQRANS